MKLLQEKIDAKKKIKESETMQQKRNRRLWKKSEKEKKRQGQGRNTIVIRLWTLCNIAFSGNLVETNFGYF